MKSTKNELKLNRLQFMLFDVAFSMLFFHNILVSFSTVPMPTIVQLAMLLIAFGAFLLFIAKQKLSFKTIVQTAIFVLIGAITYYFTKKMDLFYISFMLFFLSFVDEKSFLKVSLRNRIFIVLALFILAKTGLIRDIYITNQSMFQNSSYRYGCGFKNPNTFGFSLVLISIEAILLMRHARKKKTIEMIAIILLALLFIYIFSGTKTAYIILLIELLIVIMPRRMKNIKSNRIKPYYFLFPVFTLITFLLCYLYKSQNSFATLVNDLITNRIDFLNRVSDNYSLKLFGNNIAYSSVSGPNAQIIICDNLYYYQIFNIGIVAWLIWSFLSFITFWYLRKRNDKYAILLFAVILIMGFVENTMSIVFFMPFILYFAHALRDFLKGGFKNENKAIDKN